MPEVIHIFELQRRFGNRDDLILAWINNHPEVVVISPQETTPVIPLTNELGNML